MALYRLYARHTDGQTSVWDGEFSSFSAGCLEVSSAIMVETNTLPRVILTLVTDEFKQTDE